MRTKFSASRQQVFFFTTNALPPTQGQPLVVNDRTPLNATKNFKNLKWAPGILLLEVGGVDVAGDDVLAPVDGLAHDLESRLYKVLKRLKPALAENILVK